MSEENQDMITSILTPLLEDTNGIYIDADIMLPVLGGRVNNGWGWGLYNDVFVRGTIPSLSIANVKAGGDLMLAFGFGFPLIETDNHFLSIGFNTKVLGRMEVVYDGDVSSLTKTDFSQLPTYLYGIAGADVGLTYNLLDILTVSLAWKDFYYGVVWNKLFRRRLIEDHRLSFDDKLAWCEDFLFNLEYLRYAKTITVLKKPLYFYVKTKGSLVNTMTTPANVIRTKLTLFEYYKDLYQSLDLYEKNRLKIQLFLIQAAGDKKRPVDRETYGEVAEKYLKEKGKRKKRKKD